MPSPKCPHGKYANHCGDCRPDSAYELYRRSAEQRRLRFTISLEDFGRILAMPCRYCVDRVRNDIGYEVWNLVACCSLDNFLKGRRTMQEYLTQCQRVTQYQRELATRQHGTGTTRQNETGQVDKSLSQPQLRNMAINDLAAMEQHIAAQRDAVCGDDDGTGNNGTGKPGTGTDPGAGTPGHPGNER